MTITAGRLLGRTLRATGVDAVYGLSLPDIRVVAAPPPVAALLAVAHRRVHGRPAAVHLGGGHLQVGGGDPDHALVIDTPDDLVDASAEIAAAVHAGRCDLHAGLALDAPAPDRVVAESSGEQGWEAPAGAVEALTSARRPIVLAGPGVVGAGEMAGLHALAAAGSLGVLNTWGAKGVFDWHSRHHLATIGLQEHDFRLGGLGEADLIVATGLDEREAPDARWRLAPAVVLDPESLGAVAERWGRPRTEIDVPPLRARLAAVTQEGWAAGGAPMAPSRVTQHYGRCFGSGGLVAADPGVAGYWVARTLGTTEPATVQVPAGHDQPGLAPACALVARLRRPERPVLAVVDGPIDDAVAEVLEVAAAMGVALPLEVWSDEGDRLEPEAHLERVRRLAFSDKAAVVSLATDPRQLTRMISVAGPVIAWSEPA